MATPVDVEVSWGAMEPGAMTGFIVDAKNRQIARESI
jgi:hypothetical protein